FSSDPQKVEKGLDKLGIHEGLGMHAIATKGQRVLAQDLQRRKKVPPKSIQVCDNFAVFQEKLSAHFKDAKEGEKKLFLVRHRNHPKSLTRHTSPVFVWKHEGKFQLYLVDSGGGQKATNVIHDTLRSIQASNPPKGSEIHYDGGPGRLTDGNNCVILSFKEGVRMLRETETIDGWVRDHREQKGEGLFAITHLPPQFANLAQTFTYLRKYQDETGIDPLGERAKKHVYTGTDPKSTQEKPFNGKVAHTYLKFERRIIADCIANATEIREANFKKASLFTFLTPEG
ncbi:MAG: hypothetical protein KDK65_01460, partial [Chlamydiia bacterium]|nr:hypothetical protein [Chlamydiia bacterium]